MNKLVERYRSIGASELSRVVSVNEVAGMFGLSYSGVLYHIDEDNLVATQTLDNTWLIWLPSAILFFGTPPHPAKRVRDLDFDDVSEGHAGAFRWGISPPLSR